MRILTPFLTARAGYSIFLSTERIEIQRIGKEEEEEEGDLKGQLLKSCVCFEADGNTTEITC